MACCGDGAAKSGPKTIRYKTDKDMACKDCGDGQEYNVQKCDSCFLVDGDERNKRVRWCTFCQAFICDACENDWPKRVKAFGASAVEAVRKYFASV